MSRLPPPIPDPDKTDKSQLKLIGILHLALAALALSGLGFLALHYLMMQEIFTNPEFTKNARGGPPPEEVLLIMRWFYVVAAVACCFGALANVISGVCILKRKARMLSMIMAGLNCLGFPLGTALGIFTLIVLLRESVISLYRRPPAAVPPPNVR